MILIITTTILAKAKGRQSGSEARPPRWPASSDAETPPGYRYPEAAAARVSNTSSPEVLCALGWRGLCRLMNENAHGHDLWLGTGLHRRRTTAISCVCQYRFVCLNVYSYIDLVRNGNPCLLPCMVPCGYFAHTPAQVWFLTPSRFACASTRTYAHAHTDMHSDING